MPRADRLRRQSRRTALCGLIAALTAVILSLGSLVPLASFACPLLAMACLLPAVEEFGPRAGLLAYAASAALSLPLCADKEAAFLYLFLGWYPALRPRLERLPRPAGTAVKAGLFCLSVTCMYALLLHLVPLEALAEEFAEYSAAACAGLLVLGCGVFLLYDRTLGVLTIVLRRKRWK